MEEEALDAEGAVVVAVVEEEVVDLRRSSKISYSYSVRKQFFSLRISLRLYGPGNCGMS